MGKSVYSNRNYFLSYSNYILNLLFLKIRKVETNSYNDYKKKWLNL